MKTCKLSTIAFLLLSVAIFAGLSESRGFSHRSIKNRLNRIIKKNNVVARRHRNEDIKKHDENISPHTMQGLERRFETIKDLGDIIKCRLHNSETVVTGDHLICDGKKSRITPEAAEDIEERASTRQGVMMSPSGYPRDLQSALQSGVYGRPVASFLGDSYGEQSANNLKPHDKYPMLGIYESGMRTSDSKFTGTPNVVPMSADTSSSDDDSFDEVGHGHTRSFPEPRSFGRMELADISQTMKYDNDATRGYDGTNDMDDQNGIDDSFYRNAQDQQNAFSEGAGQRQSSNPFGEYWRSLKSSFYGTTASQLGEQDPSANSHRQIYEDGETRSTIATKKSSISLSSSSVSKGIIPRPEIVANAQNDISSKGSIPKPAETPVKAQNDIASKGSIPRPAEIASQSDISSNGSIPKPAETPVKVQNDVSSKGSIPKPEIQPKAKVDASAISEVSKAKGTIPKPEIIPQSKNAIPKPGMQSVPIKNAATTAAAVANAGAKRYFINGPERYPIGMFAGMPSAKPWQYPMNGQQQRGFARSINGPFNAFPNNAFNYQYRPGPWRNDVTQQAVSRSWGNNAVQPGAATPGYAYGSRWGPANLAPRSFDPYLAGGAGRGMPGEPLDRLDIQMRSQHMDAGPGHPRQGEMQYGIQPNTKPPFIGYVPVPIMQPVRMNFGGQGMGGGNEHGGYGGQNMGGAQGMGGGSEHGGYGGQNMGGAAGFGDYGRQGMWQGNQQGGYGKHEMGGNDEVEEYERQGTENEMRNRGVLQSQSPDQTVSQGFSRSTLGQEDASRDFESLSDPQHFMPAPYYRDPYYNPRETEDFFPEGAKDRAKETQNNYIKQYGGYNPQFERTQGQTGNPEDAAELYEDEVGEVEREEQKRAKGTHLNLHGNKLDVEPSGKMVFTKDHVGFGPITVEAKTANSAMKDPTDDD